MKNRLPPLLAQILQFQRAPQSDAANNIVERYPVDFQPASTTRVNVSRLPGQDDLATMEMACREDPRPDEKLYEEVRPELRRFVFRASLAAIAVHLVGPVISFKAVFIIAIIVSIAGAVLDALRLQEISLRRILGWLFAPALVVVALYVLSAALSYRITASLLLLAASLALMFRLHAKAHPIYFYREWLFTAPHLRPETRLKRHEIAADGALSLTWSSVIAVGLVALVIIAPIWSPMFALGLLFIAAFALNLGNPWNTLAKARPVLGRYLAHGMNDSGAPGTWRPEAGLQSRRQWLALTAFLFYLALSTGMRLYFPADAVERRLAIDKVAAAPAPQPTTSATAKPSPNTAGKTRGNAPKPAAPSPAAANVAPTPAPPTGPLPGPKDLLSLMWATKTFRPGTLFFFFVVPVLYALFIPNILLLGMFRHFLVGCEKLEAEIEDLDKEDRRTPWQWRVDRIRESQHVAADSFENEVRESHHLFLGLEPRLGFPVVVDKRILAEHCYMVGQTGSGKTSLGIMPLLIQLIRGHNVATPAEYRDAAVSALDDFASGGEQIRRQIRQQSMLPTIGNVRNAVGAFIRSRITPNKVVYGAALHHFQEDCENSLRMSEQRGERGEEALNRLFDSAFKKKEALIADPDEAGRIVRQRKVTSPPVPIVIIDLKGDPALFHTARIEARARGQKFFHFTLEQGKPTYRFNPFQGFESEHRTLIQLCNLFLDALSLNHGDSYGRSYYSRQARMLLFDALDDEKTLGKKPRTFPDLLEVIKKLSRSDRYRDAYELLATVHALTQYDQLITSEEQRVSAKDESVIHMPRVIEESQVVYFWLPAAIESISVREVGKLALFCLLSAAMDRQREGKEPRQTYLIIDEFQRIAGENLKIILEQARSFGLSAILSNQTLSDLKTRDWDLRPTIRTNTRLQLYFSVTDPTEVQMLSEMSGDETIRQKSWTVSSGHGGWAWNRQIQHMHSQGWQDGLKRRLIANDIAQISDHPLELVAFVSRGEGYTQYGGLPFPVETLWPISKADYEKRKRAPWPTEGDVITNQPPRVQDKEARHKFSELGKAMQQDMLSIMEEVRRDG